MGSLDQMRKQGSKQRDEHRQPSLHVLLGNAAYFVRSVKHQPSLCSIHVCGLTIAAIAVDPCDNTAASQASKQKQKGAWVAGI